MVEVVGKVTPVLYTFTLLHLCGCVQVVDSLLVGEADARARNKMAADLVNAFSSLRNKHATLHGVK